MPAKIPLSLPLLLGGGRCFQVGPGFSPASKRAVGPYHSAEGRSEAAGEATDSIAFALAVVFFLHFQPKNRVSSPKTT
jgi:hypothetical protein